MTADLFDAGAGIVAQAAGDDQAGGAFDGDQVATLEGAFDFGYAGGEEAFVFFNHGFDRAVIDGQVDLGVHSAKDLPAGRPDALRLVGVPAREVLARSTVLFYGTTRATKRTVAALLMEGIMRTVTD